MKVLTLVVCLAIFIAGCGSAGARSTANSVTMQGGQWEYAVVPENGGVTMYFGTNVPTTSANFNGSNVVIFQPSQITLTQNIAPIACQGYSISGTINGTRIDGQFDRQNPNSAFRFHLWTTGPKRASDFGRQIFRPEVRWKPIKCIRDSYGVHGSATQRHVHRHTNQQSLWFGHHDGCVYAHPDFSVNVMGTFVENGVTTTFVNVPGADSSFIVGASLFFGANTVNVNGNAAFSVLGHLNPAGTQLTMMLNGPNETAIGTLTKQ